MKKDLKIRAGELRASGHSFREISEKLQISKSTASLWARNVIISGEGKKRFNNLLIFSQIKAREALLNKNEIYEKNLAERCGALKTSNNFSKDQLKVFVALLYWGEGSKTKKNLTFTNSDHNLILSYLKLLRASFEIKEEKIVAWLHLHDYHNRPEMIKFWSKITGIDKKRIHVYNKKNSGIRKKMDYKGCISIRYGDYKIFDEIMLIINRFSQIEI